jgi:hypothetical protein
MQRVVATLRKQWFLVGVVLVILFAKLAPWIGRKGGILRPEYTVKVRGTGAFVPVFVMCVPCLILCVCALQ